MSATTATTPSSPRPQWLGWLPVVLGLAVMYGPSLYDLFTGIWSSDEQMHGPIVLGISLWLMYRNWPAMEQAANGQPTSGWGWPVFVFGLLLYALGRSQDILLFEIGSTIWVLTGLGLLLHGRRALRVQWFALFFMLFMVPLPGAVVDTVTMPMKMAVSYVAEQVLYWAGYGGSCFPKDVQALIKTAEDDAGIHLKVLHAVEAANDAQKRVLGRKVLQRFGSNLKGMHFAVWGLAFKANTDDMRKATSRDVIADLLSAGATVTAYDPVAMNEARHCFENDAGVTYAENQTAALEGADALIIVTEWREFRSPNFDTIKAKLKHPVIFDGRNLYDPKQVRGMGFEYLAIGR